MTAGAAQLLVCSRFVLNILSCVRIGRTNRFAGKGLLRLETSTPLSYRVGRCIINLPSKKSWIGADLPRVRFHSRHGRLLAPLSIEGALRQLQSRSSLLKINATGDVGGVKKEGDQRSRKRELWWEAERRRSRIESSPLSLVPYIYFRLVL